MNLAYVDASCVVAVALGEPRAGEYTRRTARFDVVVSSNLLEAEVRAALAREGTESQPNPVSGVTWVLPDRPLGPEIALVLAAGYLRGADLWHLACALYASEGRAAETTFFTLDERQRAVAERLGFAV